MRPARHVQLLNKAVDAATAAIEIYNKPAFLYREEAFAILMLNAWELLLKARILRENGNSLRSIEVWEGVRKKDGSSSSRRHRPKQNRSGNNLTIGMQNAINLVRSYPEHGIDASVSGNLEILTEIRDNAVHLHNKSKGLQRKVQEVGSAALRNFAHAAFDWFARDLSRQNFAIMPVAFETPQGIMKAVLKDSDTSGAGKLLKLISDTQAAQPFDPSRAYNVSIEVDVRFARAVSSDAIKVVHGPSQPGSVPIMVTEEVVLQKFSWAYADLIKHLGRRYENFCTHRIFHQRKRELEQDLDLCKTRLLDPKKPRGSKKIFYNPNIISRFDDLFLRRGQAPVPPPDQEAA